MSRNFKNAPNWCKNAITSTRGWVDPNTGELLISMKGLLDNVDVVAELEEYHDIDAAGEISKIQEQIDAEKKAKKVATAKKAAVTRKANKLAKEKLEVGDE